MAFDGSGNFVRIHSWTDDRNNTIKITADRHDAEDDGFATGLTACITKNGESTTSAVIPFAAGLRVSAGSVGTPSIGFIADTNTGFYNISTDAIGMALGGSAVGTFASTGFEFAIKTTITSNSTGALAVGRQGATDPALLVDSSTASCVTGLKITSKAAGNGVAVSGISSGTNENLTFDAKGSGTITIGSVSTGAISLARATTVTGNLGVTGTGTITSADGNAFSVGRQGATSPAFVVNAATGSSATGVSVTAAAAGGGVAIAAVSSGTNEALTLDAKGTGAVTIAATSTGDVNIGSSGSTTTLTSQYILKPNFPAFLAYNSATDTNVTGNNTTVTVDFDTEVFDRGSDFSGDTFTAPVTGLYDLRTMVRLTGLVAGTSEVTVTFVTTLINYTFTTVASAATQSFVVTALANMTATNTAIVQVTVNGNGSDDVDVVGDSGRLTYFCGHLVG